MTKMELLPEIFKLNRHDQLEIVEAIRNHLVGAIAPVDEAEFKFELERRLRNFDEKPEDESPLHEMMARLRASR